MVCFLLNDGKAHELPSLINDLPICLHAAGLKLEVLYDLSDE